MDGNHRIEDQHPLYRSMAYFIGAENAIKLARHYGGMGIYFPKLDSHLSPKKRERDRKIKEEADSGSTYKKLGKKYGLSKMRIYQIVKAQRLLEKEAHDVDFKE